MADMFASGLELLVIGMGIVFLFLTLLVILVTAMTWTVQRFFAEPPASPTARPAPPATAGEEDEAALIAAISAAVHRHRHRSR